MFYIFMVWNKRLDIHTLVYDMENNILYDNKDVTVKLLGDDSLDAFLADAEKKVQKRKATAYRVNTKRHKAKPSEQEDPLLDYFARRGLYDPFEI